MCTGIVLPDILRLPGCTSMTLVETSGFASTWEQTARPLRQGRSSLLTQPLNWFMKFSLVRDVHIWKETSQRESSCPLYFVSMGN